MKILEYKQLGDLNEPRTLNKKKIVVASIIGASILFFLLIYILYVNFSGFRNFMDKYILMKNVNDTKLPSISIEQDENLYTYAFHDYIVVMENNDLNLYNSSGKLVQTLKINISSPIFASKGKYLVVAEKNQQKTYLIKDKKILWEKDVDGNITRVTVNENGYVGVIVSGTSYKSVINTYDNNGNEKFKTFLSSTVATEVTISGDNKYLSFCELDVSGTLVESRVKTISVEEAKQNPEKAIIYTYNIPDNMLVTGLEYHQRNTLICMCDNQICMLKNGAIETIDKIADNVSYAGIKLSKSYFKVTEEMQGVNNQHSMVEIKSTTGNKTTKYKIKGIAKSVSANNGVITVNIGTEIYFLNEKGWLIKKINTSQEVKDIVLADNIAGIIYRNKIQFVSL